jgi:hypothetical protein
MDDAELLAGALEGLTPRQVVNIRIAEDITKTILGEVIEALRDPRTGDWDGHEVREFLAYKFLRERTSAMSDQRSRRYRYEEVARHFK